MDTEQKPQPTNDTPEKKARGGCRVWCLLGLGVLLLLMVTMVNNSSGLTLEYSDLLKLVKASGKLHPGFIEIVDPTSGQRQRISNLSNVVVGSSNVTGKVDREFLTASSGNGSEKKSGRTGDKDKGIEVRADRLPEEQRLTELLEKAEIDWRYAGQPNPLYNYLPLLLMTVLLVMMFVFMIRRITPKPPGIDQ